MFDNMGDEFRGGVCGGTRWNIPATSTTTPQFGFSPCFGAMSSTDQDQDQDQDQETFDWFEDMKGILVQNDAHSHNNIIPDLGLNHGHNILAMEEPILEDNNYNIWRQQTFNVNGGGEISRTNHHTSLSDNSLQFKTFSQQNLVTTSFDTPNNMSFGYSSKLLQTLFEDDDDEDLVHKSNFENRPLPINYPCTNNSPPIRKPTFDPSIMISDQAPPLWNTNSSVSSLNDIANNLFPSSNRLIASSMGNLSFPKVTSSPTKRNNNSDKQPLKRSRMETPSPLPTFKVRKEKLGDRITALQQLVSPFGKTDTASVLHEAIDYIKFLHNQVNVLSSPYSRNRKPTMRHGTTKNGENSKNDQSSYVVVVEEGINYSKQDLKSRGLCLVPLSSTIPVAIETTRAVDIWTPNFVGGLR